MNAIIEGLKAHANANYEAGGWDVLVECWSDKEIQGHLDAHNARSIGDAIEAFKPLVSIWAERQADARNSAF